YHPRQSPRKEERLDYQSSGALYGLYRSTIGPGWPDRNGSSRAKAEHSRREVADDFCRTGPGGGRDPWFHEGHRGWRNKTDLGRCDPRHRGWRNYVWNRDCNAGQTAVYGIARWHLCAPNSDGIAEQPVHGDGQEQVRTQVLGFLGDRLLVLPRDGEAATPYLISVWRQRKLEPRTRPVTPSAWKIARPLPGG